MSEKEEFSFTVDKLIGRFVSIIVNRPYNIKDVTEYREIIDSSFPIEFASVFCDFIEGNIPNETDRDIESFLNKIIDNLLDSYNSGNMSEGNSKFFVAFVNEIKKQIKSSNKEK